MHLYLIYRLKKHVKVCELGRTRTLFRKQISDVLEWLGSGSYRCTFCQEVFRPAQDDVTKVGSVLLMNDTASNLHVLNKFFH